MKATTDNTGASATPVNPFLEPTKFGDKFESPADYEVRCKNHNRFHSKYPTRPLTIPQEPNSEIEVEDDVVWKVKFKMATGWYELVPEQVDDVKTQFPNQEYQVFYQPIDKPKEAVIREFGNGVVDIKMIEVVVKTYYNYLHSWEEPNPLNLIKEIQKHSQPYQQPIPPQSVSSKIAHTQSASVESVEQAVERRFKSPLLTEREMSLITIGAQFAADWQKHQSNKEVVELIESSFIDEDEDISHLCSYNQALTDLLTQIKIQHGK